MNTLRRLPGALLFLGRGAAFSVRDNLSLAALALALAVSLWLFVTDRENPTEQRFFNSAIPVEFVNVPNDLAVSAVSESSVRVRIEANENDFEGLTVDDFEATVNLGGLPAGVETLPVEVSGPGRVNVVQITPPNIDVTLEPRRSREVPVRAELIGTTQAGFSANVSEVEPDTATVTGPESLVELVDSVVAEVDVTAARVDVTDERVALQPRDARDGVISRVTVQPQTASVEIDIEQQEYSAAFVVRPTITGAPEDGYNVTAINVSPPFVTVTASLEVLQSLDAIAGIATEEISIADVRGTVTRTVELNLPEGARVPGNPSITVEVQVQPARGEFTFIVTPQILNVAAGLTVTSAQPVAVTLAGDVPTLQQLSPQSIQITADAAGLGEGLHVLPLQINAPEGTTVVNVEPPELGVALISQ